MKYLALLILVICAPLFAVEKNIFGKDDRQFVSFKYGPYSRIVYLSSGCSGALVGPNLVLTAAHCISDYLEKGDSGNYSFHSDVYVYGRYFKGKYGARALVSSATWGGLPEEDGGVYGDRDWAILTLDENLGDKYGYFGYYNSLPSSSVYKNKVNVTGFSGDRDSGQALSTHKNCNIRRVTSYSFEHDCDSARGASGAPIWVKKDNEYYIIGIHYAEDRNESSRSLQLRSYDGNNPNFGIRPRVWARTLSNMR